MLHIILMCRHNISIYVNTIYIIIYYTIIYILDGHKGCKTRHECGLDASPKHLHPAKIHIDSCYSTHLTNEKARLLRTTRFCFLTMASCLDTNVNIWEHVFVALSVQTLPPGNHRKVSLRGPHCPPWRPRFNVDSVGGSSVRITTLCHFVDDSFLRLEHGYTGKDQVTDNVLSEFYNSLPKWRLSSVHVFLRMWHVYFTDGIFWVQLAPSLWRWSFRNRWKSSWPKVWSPNEIILTVRTRCFIPFSSTFFLFFIGAAKKWLSVSCYFWWLTAPLDLGSRSWK